VTESCIFCLRDDEELNTIMRENDSFFARYDNFPGDWSAPGGLADLILMV
jgi:hypothetical protein